MELRSGLWIASGAGLAASVLVIDAFGLFGPSVAALHAGAIMAAARTLSGRIVLRMTALCLVCTALGGALAAEFAGAAPEPAGRGLVALMLTALGAFGADMLRRRALALDMHRDALASAESMRDALRLLRTGAQAAQLGGWRMTVADQRMTWTPGVAPSLGVEPEALETLDSALRYVTPEHRELVRGHIEACARDGAPFDFEYEAQRRNGERFWVRDVGRAVHDAEGRVTALEGALLDIEERKREEAERERLQTRMDAALESMSDGFLLLDHDARIRFANGEAIRLLRRPSRELIGRTLRELFPQTTGGMLEKRIAEAIRTGVPAAFEQRNMDMRRWLDIRLHPTGEGLAIFFLDITQRREEHDRLRQFENAIARLPDTGLMVTDGGERGRGPRIIYVNDALVEQTGFSREELLGRSPWTALRHAPEQAGMRRRVVSALRAGRAMRVETRSRDREGRSLWYDLDMAPLKDDDGRISRYVIIGRDITERKRAEQALALSEERFRLVSRSTNDVIWDWNVDSGEVWYSANLHEQFGHSPRALSPDVRRWLALIDERDKPRVEASFDGVLRRRDDQWSSEYRIVKGDGSTAVITDRAYVMRDETGRAVRMIGSLRDVTEQRAMEQQLQQAQRLDAVGQLTGGVAHDFNNLLTVVIGNSELLTERLAEQPRLQALARIAHQAAQRGAELTERLLAFSRRQPLHPRDTDVAALIEGMAPLLRSTLGEPVELTLDCDPEADLARIDASQLESAVLNLCLNARDAMSGAGRLRVSVSQTKIDAAAAAQAADLAPGAYVRVSVSDDGAGMSEKDQAQAFEPFFTTKGPSRGSGLGLSQVYGFVKQSKGHVALDSRLGEGTEVTLFLPSAGPRAEAAETAETTDTGRADGAAAAPRAPAPAQAPPIAARPPADPSGAAPAPACAADTETGEAGPGAGQGVGAHAGAEAPAKGEGPRDAAPIPAAPIPVAVPPSTPASIPVPAAIPPRPADPAGPASAPAAPAADAPIGAAARILLVEDNALVRDYAADMLRGLGYEVAEAETGTEALEVLRGDAEVDLLFTDILMPGGLDGRGLAREAAKLRPKLPVLFATGFAGAPEEAGGDGAALGGAGADGAEPSVLLKPYRRSELSDRVRAALDPAPAAAPPPAARRRGLGGGLGAG